MRVPRPSPALVIACLALLLAAGGVSCATVKATGSATNIVDPANAARIAKVDGNGRLMVGDGSGPLTVDGTVSQALPKDFASLALGAYDGSGSGDCGSVAFPSGKALVVTSIFADPAFPPTSPGPGTFWSLRKGTTCSSTDIIADHPDSGLGGKTIPFVTGFAVPASAGGLSLWVKTVSGSSLGVTTYVYGYWVPASAVPASPESG